MKNQKSLETECILRSNFFTHHCESLNSFLATLYLKPHPNDDDATVIARVESPML